MKITLVGKKEVSQGVVEFSFESDEEVTWEPGWYWKLTLDHKDPDERGTERWFTLSSAPCEKRLCITTRMDGSPQSSWKHALGQMNIGGTLEADAPEGEFTLPAGKAGDYIWLAGGIGITPFRSILVQADHDGVVPHIHLLYGVRDNQPPYRDELDALAAKHANLKIDYLVEPHRLSVDTIKEYVSDFTKPTFYVSGPEPMVEKLGEILTNLEVSADRVKGDYFPGYTGV